MSDTVESLRIVLAAAQARIDALQIDRAEAIGRLREMTDRADRAVAELERLRAATASVVEQTDVAAVMALEGARELEQLREENARLRDVEAECSSRAHGEAMLKEQLDASTTLLGRAVAALQEARAALPGGYATTEALLDKIDAILADPSATAATDAWRAQQEERAELEAVYQAAKLQRDNWSWNPFDAAEVNRELSCALASAVSKVDARRGGGR